MCRHLLFPLLHVEMGCRHAALSVFDIIILSVFDIIKDSSPLTSAVI